MPQTHRSFTVRVPLEFYEKMSGRALKESKHLNTLVNELLRLGWGEAINLNATLESMIKKEIFRDS